MYKGSYGYLSLRIRSSLYRFPLYFRFLAPLPLLEAGVPSRETITVSSTLRRCVMQQISLVFSPEGPEDTAWTDLRCRCFAIGLDIDILVQTRQELRTPPLELLRCSRFDKPVEPMCQSVIRMQPHAADTDVAAYRKSGHSPISLFIMSYA